MAGTVHLPPAAVGCYIRLLCFQWSHGYIPNDPRQLAQITGVYTEEEKQMLSICLLKFKANENGTLENERLETERQKKLAISQRRSESGKLGGRPAKNGVFENDESKPKASRKQTESKSEAKQKPPNRKKEVWIGEPEFDMECAFGDFWSAFPVKNGKPSARKAFEAAINRLSKLIGSARMAAEKLKTAAEDYSEYLRSSPSPPSPKYAQGWLNDERYDVDYSQLLNDEFARASRPQLGSIADRRLNGTTRAIEEFAND